MFSGQSIAHQQSTKQLSKKGFQNWTSQQVCSLLVSKARIPFDQAKLCYEHGFDGIELDNLIGSGDSAIFKLLTIVSQNRIRNWVQQSLQPSIWSLWDRETTRLMLTKSREMGGMGLSEEESELLYEKNFDGKVINEIYDSVDENISNRFAVNSQFIQSLKDCIREIDQLVIPLMSFKLLTVKSMLPDYSHSMPYQNNKKCVKNMAIALLENAHQKEARYKQLVCNFAYFGFGKTRIGVQFQELLKAALSDNTPFNNNQTFSEYLKSIYFDDQIESLVNARMVYIDFSVLDGDFDLFVSSHIVNNLKVPHPPDEMPINEWIASLGPIYLVFDEFQMFVQQTAKESSVTIKNYYDTWYNNLLKLQMLNNVFMYVCGKGLLFELIGKGYFRENNGRSPTSVYSVNLSALDSVGIQRIMSTHPIFSKFANENLANYVLEKTGGIPVVVHYALMSSFSNSESIDNLKKGIENNISQASPQIIAPYGQASFSKAMENIYKALVWSSILKKVFVKNELVDVFSIGNVEEFKELLQIDVLQLSVFCNSYIEEVDDGFRFVFPQIIVDRYIQEYDTDISNIYQISKNYPQLLTGNILEHIISLRLHTLLSTNENSLIGEKIPFLKETPLGKEQFVIPQSSFDSFGKVTLTTANNTQESSFDLNVEDMSCWSDIIKWLRLHPNEMYRFSDHSHSPDTITFLKSSSSETGCYLCIQEKNESDFLDFTTIKSEVLKTLHLFHKIDTNHEILILVIIARIGCDLDSNVYSASRVKKQKSRRIHAEDNEFELPKGFYLVIPSVAELNQFLGSLNVRALTHLAYWEKKTITLSNILELVVPLKESTEPKKKKNKK